MSGYLIVSFFYFFYLFLLELLDWPTESLNPSERVIPNGLGYLDNPGPDSLFQLTDGQFRPSTNGARRRARLTSWPCRSLCFKFINFPWLPKSLCWNILSTSHYLIFSTRQSLSCPNSPLMVGEMYLQKTILTSFGVNVSSMIFLI